MTKLTVTATVHAPLERVWKYYTEPTHVTRWNNASSDWHTPHAKNDLKVGGKFLYRMEAKDKSAGFDFEGTYTEVEHNKQIAYTMSDGRNVRTTFIPHTTTTTITVVFDAETENSLEMQKEGWQSILNNFKKYVENA